MKRGMTWISLAVAMLLLAGITILFLGYPPQAEAQKTCSVGSVRGTYGFHIQGWVSSGTGRQPVAQVGQIVADGFGRMNLSFTMSADGEIIRTTFCAGYQVNPDCTGSLTPDPGTWAGPADFAIVEGGKQLLIIASSEGTTLSGVAIRQ